GAEQANRFAGYVSKTYRPDDPVPRFSAKLARTFDPASLPNEPVLQYQIVRERQHKKYDRLGHRPHYRGRSNKDGDIVFRAGRQIHVIVADTAAADGGKTLDAFQ